MAEAKRRRRATARMLEEFPDCCLDGGTHRAESREHFPPTSFFDGARRPKDIEVPACRRCNNGSALADLLACIISRVGFGAPTAHERTDIRVLAEQLKKRRPDLHGRMLGAGSTMEQRAFRHYRELGLALPVGSAAIRINGEMFQHLHLFSHKAVLAHYFAKLRRPLPNQGGVLSFLRPKETVALGALPAELLNLLGPVNELVQGKRRHPEYEFREAHNKDEGIYGLSCRFREGFFVFGLAVEDLSKIDPEMRKGFVLPGQLFSILQDDRYTWFDQFRKEAPVAAA
jgi:hypothetical protein